MTTVRELSGQEHEHVFAFRDEATGLSGYIAIHNTRFGPAVAGIRTAAYRSDLAALSDALRLSRSMAYKVALAGLPCGAAQVVLVEHFGLKRKRSFEELGRLIELCGGRLFGIPDAGTTHEDLRAVRSTTRRCLDECSPHLGDLAEHTATGVWEAMQACVYFVALRRPRVAIQGLGRVGMSLARILHREGLNLIVADIERERTLAAEKEFGAKVVAPDDIFSCDADVFAPCAVGAVINVHTIPKLRARIVCGSAQNVLASRDDAEKLRDYGIIYVPDYLANVGGLIRAVEFGLEKKADSQTSISQIRTRMKQVVETAEEKYLSTLVVADQLAESRMGQATPVTA